MDEEARNAFIARINSCSAIEQDIAYLAYMLGHEDGWWLNRKDPNEPASEIAIEQNPFTANWSRFTLLP